MKDFSFNKYLSKPSSVASAKTYQINLSFAKSNSLFLTYLLLLT